MLFGSFNGRFFAGTALLGFMLAAAGCQSSDGGVLGMGGDKPAAVKPEAGKVTATSLRAYCPKVTLRDGTAYFNTYGRGGKKAATDVADDTTSATDQQNDSSNIIYQAAITDVTRDCTHADGTMTINVAVAGKVVPGPLGKPGDITMPIRVAVMRGTDVLYSKLHQYKLQVSDMSAATQFVFKDPNIAIPEPDAANLQVFAGYDEGPKATAKPQKKRIKRKKTPETAAAPPPAQSGSQTSISDIPR
jgi:hypothetical protein